MKPFANQFIGKLGVLALLTGVSHSSVQAEDSMILFGGQEDGARVELNEARFGTRYRYAKDAADNKIASLLEYAATLDVSVYFWGDRIQIDLEAATGDNALSKYVASTIGDEGEAADWDTEFNIRRLSLTLRPDNNGNVELTIGAFSPEHGAGTELTGLDKDIPIMGYKAKVKYGEGKGYVAVTMGNVDPTGTVNVFDRFEDFGNDNNYLQVLVHHMISEALSVSVDWTQYGADNDNFIRGAVKYSPSQWKNTTIILEAMTRLQNDDIAGDEAGYVFAATINHKLENVLAGRTVILEGSLMYVDDENDIRFPLASFLPVGPSARIAASIPDLFVRGNLSVEAYTEAVFAFDNDAMEIRTGLSAGFGGSSISGIRAE